MDKSFSYLLRSSYLSTTTLDLFKRANACLYNYESVNSDLLVEHGLIINWSTWEVQEPLHCLQLDPSIVQERIVTLATVVRVTYASWRRCMTLEHTDHCAVAQQKFISWMASPTEFLRLQSLFLECVKHTTDYESIQLQPELMAVLLQLTALLERSLGDLLMSLSEPRRPKACPNMMKELLASSQLRDLLGHPLCDALTVVLGPPTSLNLRNLAWHGFLTGLEMEACKPVVAVGWLGFLLAWSHNCGFVLSQRSSDLVIIHRPLRELSNFGSYFLSLAQKSDYEAVELITCLSPSGFCPVLDFTSRHLHRSGGRQREAFFLLFPLLEHYLRLMLVLHWAQEGNSDQETSQSTSAEVRVLDAQQHEFFLTFDEMLSELLNHKDNPLPHRLDRSCFTALLDVLAYEEGPRLRDRLSHGEWRPSGEDDALLPSMSCALWRLLLSVICSVTEGLGRSVIAAEIYQIVSYRGTFHPLDLLGSALQETHFQLKVWANSVADECSPNDATIITNCRNHLIDDNSAAVVATDLLAQLQSLRVNSVFASQKSVVSPSPQTLPLSHLTVGFLTNLLRTHLNHLQQWIDEVVRFRDERQRSAAERNMRTRQRENWERFLDSERRQLVVARYLWVWAALLFVDCLAPTLTVPPPNDRNKSVLVGGKLPKKLTRMKFACERLSALSKKRKWDEMTLLADEILAEWREIQQQ